MSRIHKEHLQSGLYLWRYYQPRIYLLALW